jgi:hypothetical protein
MKVADSARLSHCQMGPGQVKTPDFPRKTGQAARHGLWQCEAVIGGQTLLLWPLVRRSPPGEFGDVPWTRADKKWTEL